MNEVRAKKWPPVGVKMSIQVAKRKSEHGALVVGCALVCALATSGGIFWLDSVASSAGDNGISVAQSEPQDTVMVQKAANRSVAIPKSADGHFWLEAEVNQKAVRFLVDTGATTVALTANDAARLGYDINTLKYDRRVITASGETRAAMVSLPQIVIGQSTVRHVDALIIPEGLDTSLLGMSYLGRLERIEATRSSLILHP